MAGRDCSACTMPALVTPLMVAGRAPHTCDCVRGRNHAAEQCHVHPVPALALQVQAVQQHWNRQEGADDYNDERERQR